MNPTFPRPNGPSSLSPGRRPGSTRRIDLRPEGPRYERRVAPVYRTPLGRPNWMHPNPARWAGLRNHGPLARNTTGMSSPIPLPRASLAELDPLFATLQHRAFRGEL